jgi:arginyl-tRNA synthetase
MNLKALLEARISAALAAAGAPGAPAQLAQAARPEFGDYQANGVMAAAKALGRKPRDLAAAVVAALDLDGIARSVDIAGPGFINIRLDPGFIAAAVAPARALIEPARPQRIVVDYSAPNLAKEMHVGHLRSTIIGDAMARILEALGHRVIRQNHVGDWGTQFGMLVAHLEEIGGHSPVLADLEAFYQDAKRRFDEDPEFADRARARVVALQSGDPAVLARWREFVALSTQHCQAVYDRLGVSLTAADTMGESAYNDDLPGIVALLEQQGFVTESAGAKCVFLAEFANKDGTPVPIIVEKSDGGYLYATTDLAAIRYRCGRLRADRVLYFVDVRQSLHFRQVFALARRAGFVTDDCSLEHHPFGTMLGKDGRPFRTRDGGVVKLTALLDEAEQRALQLVSAKDPSLSPAERRNIARAIGIGAVKYADLSKNRTSDYVFDWDTMLSFDGNTAPYLQYAVTRIQSLFKRGAIDRAQINATIVLVHDAEIRLGLTLARYQESLDDVAKDASPHLLCSYLMSLASAYMQFYEHCPVLTAAPDVRDARLQLCARVVDTLTHGLGLLGIQTVPRM